MLDGLSLETSLGIPIGGTSSAEERLGERVP
jgi:hypothetical protein